ncbi:hypothetical protein [Marinirhabdus gelatinilytica]|uniref:Uncharacterized protein n=1 Tax=Marinirhabdus gelatinilytica TaxID=1703343 RepID=A0A370QLF3_9FLAO|nr:hypothetical protein [Marinirhabdus gelatinilytica]RDK89179.1 hypothetical protein C8D94_1011060 [Marinirhabdus gelatinilytica]
MISKMYKSLLTEYISGLYGYATIAIIGQSCIGSIAAMLILMNNDLSRNFQIIELFLVVILCMGFNGAVLAQQKGKIQFNILILSVLTSIIFIIINL